MIYQLWKHPITTEARDIPDPDRFIWWRELDRGVVFVDQHDFLYLRTCYGILRIQDAPGVVRNFPTHDLPLYDHIFDSEAKNIKCKKILGMAVSLDIQAMNGPTPAQNRMLVIS